MRLTPTSLLILWLLGGFGASFGEAFDPAEVAEAEPSLEAEFWGFAEARRLYDGLVWEAPLAEVAVDEPLDYTGPVAQLLARFEAVSGKPLAPGERGQVALKVYTDSGVGLHTPRGLVRAIVAELLDRGFAREDLRIVDVRELMLRQSGYLPPLALRDARPMFEGIPVIALDSGAYFDDAWFYESPVPADIPLRSGAFSRRELSFSANPEDRKSYLPYPLLHDVDFWINLPMVSTDGAVGLRGAIANATILNISNRYRFFVSPTNAPVAAAEIAAIPELLNTWALSIVSLSDYQFIGGTQYNANYVRSEPRLWMAIDPVALDAALLDRVNRARRDSGFLTLPPSLPLLRFATTLGVGQPTFQVLPVEVPAPSEL